MSLLPESRLNDIIDLPINLPATEFGPGDFTVVSAFQIEAGQKMSLSKLQISVLGIETAEDDSTDTTADECNCGSLTNEINSEFLAGSLATLFVIKDAVFSTRPDLQTYLETLVVPSDFSAATQAQAPVTALRSGAETEITDPGVYSIFVLNNSTNRNLQISVNGTMTIDLAPTE